MKFSRAVWWAEQVLVLQGRLWRIILYIRSHNINLSPSLHPWFSILCDYTHWRQWRWRLNTYNRFLVIRSQIFLIAQNFLQRLLKALSRCQIKPLWAFIFNFYLSFWHRRRHWSLNISSTAIWGERQLFPGCTCILCLIFLLIAIIFRWYLMI